MDNKGNSKEAPDSITFYTTGLLRNHLVMDPRLHGGKAWLYRLNYDIGRGDKYEGLNFNSGNYLFTTDTK